MNPYCEIDPACWPRREMFSFYRNFDAPCFTVTVKVGAEPLYVWAKRRHESFFLLALYAILRAANAVPQVRQRVLPDGRIVEFERIAVMTPIMTASEMFHQIWCEYEPDFAAFRDAAAPLVAEAGNGSPAPMEEHGADFLCASCVPWLHFEALNPADYAFSQDIPVLTWGRLEDGRIPVSVKFNHCFVDGLHVGRFFRQLEEGFSCPETL